MWSPDTFIMSFSSAHLFGKSWEFHLEGLPQDDLGFEELCGRIYLDRNVVCGFLIVTWLRNGTERLELAFSFLHVILSLDKPSTKEYLRVDAREGSINCKLETQVWLHSHRYLHVVYEPCQSVPLPLTSWPASNIMIIQPFAESICWPQSYRSPVECVRHNGTEGGFLGNKE